MDKDAFSDEEIGLEKIQEVGKNEEEKVDTFEADLAKCPKDEQEYIRTAREKIDEI